MDIEYPSDNELLHCMDFHQSGSPLKEPLNSHQFTHFHLHLLIIIFASKTYIMNAQNGLAQPHMVLEINEYREADMGLTPYGTCASHLRWIIIEDKVIMWQFSSVNLWKLGSWPQNLIPKPCNSQMMPYLISFRWDYNMTHTAISYNLETFSQVNPLRNSFQSLKEAIIGGKWTPELTTTAVLLSAWDDINWMISQTLECISAEINSCQAFIAEAHMAMFSETSTPLKDDHNDDSELKVQLMRSCKIHKVTIYCKFYTIHAVNKQRPLEQGLIDNHRLHKTDYCRSKVTH